MALGRPWIDLDQLEPGADQAVAMEMDSPGDIWMSFLDSLPMDRSPGDKEEGEYISFSPTPSESGDSINLDVDMDFDFEDLDNSFSSDEDGGDSGYSSLTEDDEDDDFHLDQQFPQDPLPQG